MDPNLELMEDALETMVNNGVAGIARHTGYMAAMHVRERLMQSGLVSDGLAGEIATSIVYEIGSQFAWGEVERCVDLFATNICNVVAQMIADGYQSKSICNITSRTTLTLGV